MTVKVAVAGASGYVGGELLRLIASHPELELGAVTANANAGQTIASVHPHLQSFAERILVDTTAENLAGHDVVFLALPHTKSAEVAALLSGETIVLDCGADFRLESAADWAKYYGGEHAGTWTYGMPELLLGAGEKQRAKLVGATRIAVPGCNVTAATIALAPAIAAGLVETDDLVSIMSVGTSGAGKGLKTSLLASEILGAASAYGVGGVHRHTPEIEQNLRKAAGKAVSISFTPVLVPMSRGILAVNTAKLAPGASLDKLRAAFSEHYGDEQFIRVLADGEYPNTSSVLGTNVCQIGIAIDEHAGRAVIVSAIDNLVKGTAGAAIQSLNIAIGFAEQTGINVNGVAP